VSTRAAPAFISPGYVGDSAAARPEIGPGSGGPFPARAGDDWPGWSGEPHGTSDRHPYTITNVNSGTHATPVSCATTNGTGIELSSALGGACQQWDIKS
jgi:hypothetical protein